MMQREWLTFPKQVMGTLLSNQRSGQSALKSTICASQVVPLYVSDSLRFWGFFSQLDQVSYLLLPLSTSPSSLDAYQVLEIGN